jgi:DNA-binding XRE family transcriptional regulator
MMPTPLSVLSNLAFRMKEVLRSEQASFGAKVRVSRAVLNLTQHELAARVGLTQKSVHRIEQGLVEPKVRTILALEQFWRDSSLEFQDLPDGGFTLAVHGSVLPER